MTAFWKNRALSTLTLLLIVSAGCRSTNFGTNSHLVGPDYSPPGAQVAENWMDFNDPRVIAATHAVDDEQWWNVFGDPEIGKVVSLANSRNLTLQASLLQIKEQQHQLAIAVGNLFPQGQEAFAEYQRQQFSENGNQFGIVGLGNSFDFYQMGFNASWEIDLWGRLRRSIEASTAQVQISSEDERDVRLSLAADVASAYTEIRMYQQRIENAHEQIAAQEQTLQIANSKFKNGAVSKLDVTQATATLDVIKANLPALESDLRQSNNRLCLLLGVPPSDLEGFIGRSNIPFSPDSIVVGMPRDLIRRRPDIRRAERVVAQQSALIGVAKAELYPAFTLRGTVNWQSFTFSDLFSSSSNGGAIIPGVRWDILNYGRIKNRILAQETRYQQAVLVYRQTVLNANTEVENSLNGFLNKKKQISLFKSAVQATRESLRIGTKQYEAGTIGYDRLNDLRKELVDQLDRLAAERGKAALFLIKFYRTMGGGWAIPQGEICQTPHSLPIAKGQTVPPVDSQNVVAAESPTVAPRQLPTNLPRHPFAVQSSPIPTISPETSIPTTPLPRMPQRHPLASRISQTSGRSAPPAVPKAASANREVRR